MHTCEVAAAPVELTTVKVETCVLRLAFPAVLVRIYRLRAALLGMQIQRANASTTGSSLHLRFQSIGIA